MQKQEKILKLFKKKFKFRKYKKFKLFNTKKRKLNIKINKTFLFFNILCNRYELQNNAVYLNNVNFLFYFINKNDTISDFCYKIKVNRKKLLLNIFFKNKSIKNNRYSKKANFEIFLKFTIFFLKKIIIEGAYNKISYIYIKIKKKQFRGRIKKKKMIRKKFNLIKWDPHIKKNIFFRLALFTSIYFNFFSNKYLKIIPLYNKSHSKNRIKFKKKRRK